MSINRRPTQQDLSWFLDLHKQGTLNLEPPYQRKSVWMPKDKKFFLNTVLSNYPCPAIYLQKETDSETFVTSYNVVDGKQRLMTVIDFYENKLRLPDDLGDDRLNNKRWKDIDDPEVKKNFLNYSFTVETLDSTMDYNKWNDVFDRLNRNSKTLSHQELRHARFDGWLVNRAEQEANDPIWKDIKISSTAKARRMKDVEFISILMLVILEEKIVGFPQSALDSLYEKYEIINQEKTEEEFFTQSAFDPVNSQDDEVETVESNLLFDEQVASYSEIAIDIEEFEDKFSKIKRWLTDFVKNSDLITDNKFFGKKRTTHIYTLWTYLALEEIPSDINEFKTKYEELFSTLQELSDMDESEWATLNIDNEKKTQSLKYLRNSIGPTTEKPQRKDRLEALTAFLTL